MSDTPLWMELYRRLREDIESGKLPPGAAVPRELQLAEEHSLSRTTVRQALQKLQADGLITPGQGRRGRKVRNPRPMEWSLHRFENGARRDDPQTGLDDWAAAVADQGRTPRQEISAVIETASADIARALDLPREDLVIRRSRIRFVDERPYQLSTSYFPERLRHLKGGDLLLEPRDVVAPGGILRHIGCPQVSIRDEVYVRMPTASEVRRLDIPPGTPVGEHRRTGYGENGEPVRYMVTVFPGDKHYLAYELELT